MATQIDHSLGWLDAAVGDIFVTDWLFMTGFSFTVSEQTAVL